MGICNSAAKLRSLGSQKSTTTFGDTVMARICAGDLPSYFERAPPSSTSSASTGSTCMDASEHLQRTAQTLHTLVEEHGKEYEDVKKYLAKLDEWRGSWERGDERQSAIPSIITPKKEKRFEKAVASMLHKRFRLCKELGLKLKVESKGEMGSGNNVDIVISPTANLHGGKRPQAEDTEFMLQRGVTICEVKLRLRRGSERSYLMNQLVGRAFQRPMNLSESLRPEELLKRLEAMFPLAMIGGDGHRLMLCWMLFDKDEAMQLLDKYKMGDVRLPIRLFSSGMYDLSDEETKECGQELTYCLYLLVLLNFCHNVLMKAAGERADVVHRFEKLIGVQAGAQYRVVKGGRARGGAVLAEVRDSDAAVVSKCELLRSFECARMPDGGECDVATSLGRARVVVKLPNPVQPVHIWLELAASGVRGIPRPIVLFESDGAALWDHGGDGKDSGGSGGPGVAQGMHVVERVGQKENTRKEVLASVNSALTRAAPVSSSEKRMAEVVAVATVDGVGCCTLEWFVQHVRWLFHDEAKQVLMQLVAILCDVWEHGVVHADVHPSNVVLLRRPCECLGARCKKHRPEDIQVMLIDFGLAYHYGVAGAATLLTQRDQTSSIRGSELLCGGVSHWAPMPDDDLQAAVLCVELCVPDAGPFPKDVGLLEAACPAWGAIPPQLKRDRLARAEERWGVAVGAGAATQLRRRLSLPSVTWPCSKPANPLVGNRSKLSENSVVREKRFVPMRGQANGYQGRGKGAEAAAGVLRVSSGSASLHPLGQRG
eukprot:TRINITY_DN7255_c0_g1_i5.p1 TRINITY_DN7255_c0_g1~~TRINITY_DN7255_c0_g1_i5.p1  ORF type:complete len:770 (-),score=153.53 TRINITY_DN7255_c0_g1_i5:469-2778(-)